MTGSDQYQRVQAATLPKTEQRRIWEGKRVIITRGSLKGYRGLVKAEDLIGVQVELDAKVALHGQARQHFQFGEFGLEPIAMPVASPNPLNRTPPPEDVARAVTPDPEEPEESTVYPQSSPQGPEIQGAVREECIPFHVWGIPASSPHASLNGLAAKTVPVTSQKITPEPNEVNVSVVHKRKPTQVSINPSNLIPWIPSEGNKVVITGHRWNGQVGKLLKLERGSCTIKLESSGEIVHCAVEDVMNTRARISTNFSSQLLCASSLLTDGPTSFLTTCEMPKQPSSPLIHARGGRMSNRPYIPSPSPPVEDFQIEWRYHKDTHLILHDNDECKTCDTWSMHYFIHTTHGNDTLQEAQTARDSFRRELEEWRQELAALRREFQEVRQELKDTVASLRDDAQTPPRRRRKRVHRARTPSPTPYFIWRGNERPKCAQAPHSVYFWSGGQTRKTIAVPTTALYACITRPLLCREASFKLVTTSSVSLSLRTLLLDLITSLASSASLRPHSGPHLTLALHDRSGVVPRCWSCLRRVGDVLVCASPMSARVHHEAARCQDTYTAQAYRSQQNCRPSHKDALESLIATLRSHMARLTSDLATHKTPLDELRTLQEADKSTLQQKVREDDLLR
ncbi:hypothetical protein EDB84DRAFT_1442272 [Lactarius hengduanensis]|nr:hypothetical protein EDB84DRAFT_1442272 [Lactarius hengduanensis]